MNSIRLVKVNALAVCLSGLFFVANGDCADNCVADVDPFASRKIFYEQHWQGKIESALKYVHGAIVNVNVDLTPEIERSVVTTEYVPRTASELEIKKTQQIPSPKQEATGRPKDASGADQNNSSNESANSVTTESYTTNKFSETRNATTSAGLIPKHVSVSVSVPKSYCEAVLAQRLMPARSDAEDSASESDRLRAVEADVRTAIEDSVAALLPWTPEDSFKRVRVTFFEDIADATKPSIGAAQRPRIQLHDIVMVTFDEERGARLSHFAHQSNADTAEATIRIPADVVSIRPNGNLVVESKLETTDGSSIRQLTLTGVVRPESVDPKRYLSSGSIADLRIVQRVTPLPDSTAQKRK